ncbi:hypothetical protein H5U35_08130 [Candidatus Aerophobetes bacterium]|nr:hypothetical protein [Candidatus Aerophobetes bacterium]
MILDYDKDGKRIKELSTLSDKALISINPEIVNEWKEKYKFENLNPTYLGPFHPLIKEIVNLLIKQNSGKFWKKKVENIRPTASIYLLIPLKIKNLTAEINTSIEILAPILYEIDKKEIKIDANKVYELASCNGKVEYLDSKTSEILKEAQRELSRNIEKIKGKIKVDIEKIKVEMEELALEKQRQEIRKKINEKRERLKRLFEEIARKRSSGLYYEKEIREAKRIKEELNELQLRQKLEKVPESSNLFKSSSLSIEFEEPQTIGGCVYIP